MGFSFKKLDPRRIGKGRFNPAEAVKKEVRKLKSEIKKEVIDEIKGELKEVIKTPEELVKKGLESIVKEGTKIIKGKFERILRASVPDGAGLKLGLVSFDFEIGDKKIERLIHLIDNGIHSKRSALALIREVAPEKVSIALEADIPVIHLGVGLYPWWYLEHFLEIAEDVI